MVLSNSEDPRASLRNELDRRVGCLLMCSGDTSNAQNDGDDANDVQRLYVLNKCDLLAKNEVELLERLVEESCHVALGSCLTETGFERIHRLLSSGVQSM